ncbi:MAG TPA: ABC transporter ATP-binding protein [Thermoanaerobaculia bacterium]|nr:ABC transporter ATP-binding protein [Thermoanaerobaculia bacterium]
MTQPTAAASIPPAQSPQPGRDTAAPQTLADAPAGRGPSAQPAAGSPPLAAEALSVTYGRKTALADVSLTVAAGTVYALLGRNGAGKSSLVRCLLGEQRPAAGRALLFGRDVWRHRARLLREVGVVPEEPNAPPAATASGLARFSARLFPRWNMTEFKERLRRFEVPADVPFGQLSKGQKGQVALALALASAPRLLILDDPTLGLDALARRAVFEELIGDLADRGTTVFLTTHDLAAVEGIALRVGILARGRLLLDEELETLKARFRRISLPLGGVAAATAKERITEAEETALSELRPVRRIARGWGVETVVAGYDEERFARLRGNPGGGRAQAAALSLEEIFLALVGTPAPGGEAAAAGPAQPAAAARKERS